MYYILCISWIIKCLTCYQILMKREFSLQSFRKLLKHQISWKSVHRGPNCSVQTDRYDEVIVAFQNFFERV